MTVSTLPPSFVVQVFTETVPGPIDIGQSVPRSYFQRWTTTVTYTGNLIAASGDMQDAINQAQAYVEASGGAEFP